MQFLTNLAESKLEQTITGLSINAVLFGSIILVVLTILAILLVKFKSVKKPLFIGFVITILSVTSAIAGGTIYLNLNSATGGPVHWHADFEIWACGNELELRDPTGLLSNKIGSPTLHEHNDKRVHLEGVPVELPYDGSLGKFMTTVGGEINSRTLVVPLNSSDKIFEDAANEIDGDGPGAPNKELVNPFIKSDVDGKFATFVNGQPCGNAPGEVQLFVYNYDVGSKTYKQTKIAQPSTYTYSQHSEVPAGDCFIVEFAPKKDRTNKLCKQYGVRDVNRCEQFGVTPDKRKICEIKEVE